jgi:L-threonylcarbamoyladenylate synthase
LTYYAATRLLRVDPDRPDAAAIAAAAEVLRAGGLVAFPTETVYGLGANALDREAIDRIYRAKQRPANDPIIAHIYATEQLALLAQAIPATALLLAERFWPGPLTLVLPRAASVPANIAAGLDTVAIRMPAHPVARALLAALDLPIAAPSANTFTRPSATTAAHVLEDLDGHVDIVLDGGPATIGLESTVLDLTNTPPVVLRPGGVVLDELRAVIPEVELSARFLQDDTPAVSPGQMLRHYAPRARMIVYSGEHEAALAAMQEAVARAVQSGRKVGVLATQESAHLFAGAEVISLGAERDLEAISRGLFAALRELDARGVEEVFVRDFGRDGLGAALWDRLVRAAEGRIIEV